MNLFRIMQSIRGWAQAGKIDFPGAVKYLTDLGVKMDGIVHQALKNVFKEGKARDPEFGNVVQKLQIDDQGIPFNPKTLKSTTEKRASTEGIENLFDEKLPNVKMGSRMNYEKIADMEGIDVELIRGKNWSEIRAIIAAVRDKADGGRVGFVAGGWADDLTGQGLSIYNSMTAGGHSDETIQDTLTELGYWPIPGATGIETIVNTNINQGGGGDGGGGGITNGYNPNQNLGTTNITDYEAEAYGVGPTWAGSWAKLKDDFSKIPSVYKLAKKGITGVGNWFNQQKVKSAFRKEKKELDAQAALDLLNQEAALSIGAKTVLPQHHQEQGGGGYQDTPTHSAPKGHTAPSKTGHMGPGGVHYNTGGLATMFTRRR